MSEDTTYIENNIFNFSDYRTFLSQHFMLEKKRQSGFSTRLWCKKLGLKSTATLNMILRGHRHPGPDVVEKLIAYFHFSHEQRLFFEQLVRLAKQGEDTEKKLQHLQRLEDLHPKKTIHVLEHHAFSYMSNWYYLAIREMVTLKDFKADEEWIAARLKYKVAPAKITQALKVMQQLKLIRCEPDGTLTQTEEDVGTSHDVAQEAVKQFHEQMLTLAKDAIRQTDVKERHVAGVTFNINKEDLPALKEELFRLQKAIYQKYQVADGEATYQFNAQLFPLTR